MQTTTPRAQRRAIPYEFQVIPCRTGTDGVAIAEGIDAIAMLVTSTVTVVVESRRLEIRR
jgi:hypothetical protein